ncbi:hypothetical protein CBL_05226 [Carabus blaptoides fortunei]
MFNHKEIHKFTREERNRNEKSIIDYILTNRLERKKVNNVKVKRGSEIGTDHYLVVAQIKARKEEPKSSEKVTKKLSETIKFRVDKLKEKHNAEEYEEYKKTEKDDKRHDKKAKEKTWEEFGEKMEENFRENQKLFYSTLKSSKGENQTTLKQLKDKHGKPVWPGTVSEDLRSAEVLDECLVKVEMINPDPDE